MRRASQFLILLGLLLLSCPPPMSGGGDAAGDATSEETDGSSAADVDGGSIAMPTMAAQITGSGFQFFSSMADKIVNREFPKTILPTISFDIPNGPGKGVANATNLHIRRFESPNFRFRLAPPDGVFLQSVDGTALIAGNWFASYTFVTTIYASGWLEALVSDIRSQLTLAVYGEDGRPQLGVLACRAKVGDLELELGGGVIPWLVNLFHVQLAELVKTAIHEQFCTVLRTSIVRDFNAQLRTLPTRMAIYDDVFIDYAYRENPIVGRDTFSGEAFVDVLLHNQSCTVRPEAVRPGAAGSPTRPYMASFWVAGSVFNCFMQTVHASGAMTFVLDKDVDDHRFRTFLATSCSLFKVCIGRLLPRLCDMFPGQWVDLHFHSSRAPHLNISGNGTRLRAYQYVDLHISPYESHRKDVLARMEIDALLDVEPRIFNDRIGGSLIDNPQLNFTQRFSRVGDLHDTALNFLAQMLAPVIRIAADARLREGVPLPLLENISLADETELWTLDDGQVRVNADFRYAEF